MNKRVDFIGRETVLKDLRALYTERRHVLIVGPAGVGKTALLQQVKQHWAALIHLPHKRCLSYTLAPNDQDVLSLSIKQAEIVHYVLPAKECKALIH